MNESVQKSLADHERRIAFLEAKFEKSAPQANFNTSRSFSFSDRKRSHNELLEELLKSDYCHNSNGLSFEMIIDVFRRNNRPVVTKKLRDLLGVWKKRGRIDAIKADGGLRYFWIENEN